MEIEKLKTKLLLREFENSIVLEDFYKRAIKNKEILNKQIILLYNQQKDKITYVLFLELSFLV